MSTEGLKKLLGEINEGMGKLIAEMEEKEINESTFEVNSPDEYEKLEPLTWIGREILAAQLQDLSTLILGPKNYINAFSTNVSNCVSYHLNFILSDLAPLDMTSLDNRT